MRKITSDNLERFYSLLAHLRNGPGQGRPLRELLGGAVLPTRGVYFFTEATEFRCANLSESRIVRVGTHAVSAGSRSTLRGRLKQHLGTRTGGGNHRGSIFRLHLGNALLAREGSLLPTWGVGASAPASVRESKSTRIAEAACENRVSDYIGAMSVLWINVPDETGPQSDRALIERNAIALLSNQFSPIDRASENWLGRFSPRREIRESALWNIKHVAGVCDPTLLEKFEMFVQQTCEGETRLAKRCT